MENQMKVIRDFSKALSNMEYHVTIDGTCPFDSVEDLIIMLEKWHDDLYKLQVESKKERLRWLYAKQLAFKDEIEQLTKELNGM